MNIAKIIGFAHRVRITKPGQRGPLFRELEAAVDEADEGASGYLAGMDRPQATNEAEGLRSLLLDEDTKASPRTMANISRRLRVLRATE